MSKIEHLPVFGPLNIENLEEFLKESKKIIPQEFNSNCYVDSNLLFSNLTRVKTIGLGSFGTVLLMQDTTEDKYYAVKAINKRVVIKTKQINHILNEKRILSVMNFPFIIHMIQFFSDNSYLYFVMPFISGGDMFTRLRKCGKFDDGLARFYAAQVVLGIEYLHFFNVVYRDLKPENVLIDHTGYIKLADFGFGKTLKTRTWTLCGTPEYLAPEVLLNKGYCHAVDWWAVGVFIFEMVSGRSPFFAKDQLKIYEKILANMYIFHPDISDECRHLIKNLLQPNISKRYGCLKNGVQDIKDHLWFRPIEWMSILNRKVEPPYVPEVSSPGEYFGDYDVTLKISDTEIFAKEFENF